MANAQSGQNEVSRSGGARLGCAGSTDLEVAPDVRVNCVCPGYVDTDMIRLSAAKKADPDAAWQKMIDYAPLKRIASTGEIAHAVMYLACDHARFITGTALAIDGGTTAGK